MSITSQQRKALAEKAGIDEQYLYQCLTGRRDMRPDKAVTVEKLSKGLLSRAELRRDWKSVWPDLKAPAPTKAKRRTPATQE